MNKKAAQAIKDKELVLDIQDYLKSKSERDYVLFILGISTGYRACDLVKLKVRDIKEALKEGYFEILENKKINNSNVKKENMKPRVAKIQINLKKVLVGYIKNKKDYEYLFASRKGNGHITVSHVGRILRDAGNYFELDHISAHSMRKTYAYKIYMKSECNIVLVQEMLGHSTQEYTKRYIGLDRDTYDKYSDDLNEYIRI